MKKNSVNKRPVLATSSPEKLMIINSPGHKYDGRRVLLDQIHSERQMVTVEIEPEVFAILRLDQVIPAPSSLVKTAS